MPFGITCSSSHECDFTGCISVDILFSHPLLLWHKIRSEFYKDVIECIFVLEMVSIHYLLFPLFLCILQFCWVCISP
jgi:hypothetical protein